MLDMGGKGMVKIVYRGAGSGLSSIFGTQLFVIFNCNKIETMTHRQLKAGFYALEVSCAFSTTFYFNYLFFILRDVYHFSTMGNLAMSALNGFIYIFASLASGKFAQRHGFFLALKIGFSVMLLSLAVGSQFPMPGGQCIVMVFWTCGMCLIWPSIEALVCANENRQGVQRMVGLYNLSWASGSAVAYFSGGEIISRLGHQSLFWLPVSIHAVQLCLTFWLEHRARFLVFGCCS